MNADNWADECNEVLALFAFAHLPERLQQVSKPFADTAHHVNNHCKPGFQKLSALQRLLESKDCAVRAAL